MLSAGVNAAQHEQALELLRRVQHERMELKAISCKVASSTGEIPRSPSKR
jgi:hypothetical protein